jgi:RNA polymerase sigma-32 factor
VVVVGIVVAIVAPINYASTTVPRTKKAPDGAGLADTPQVEGSPKKTRAKRASKADPQIQDRQARDRAAAEGRDGEDGEEREGEGGEDGEERDEPIEEATAELDSGLDPDADAEVDSGTLAEDSEGDDGDDVVPASRRGSNAPGKRGADVDSGASLTRFDPMAAYLREVQRHPLLTPEETSELAKRFVESGDPHAAARLVTANLRLVVKIAYEYRRAYKNIMDLVQEGNIGLMQAVKRYDPYRGVKLSSYAAWWIRAYILRFILNNWRLVKLGTTQAQRKLFFNLRKKRAELQAMGIDPTHAEIAKQLNVPESEVADMDVRLTANEKSLDAPVGDSEGRAIAKVDMMPSAAEGPETLMAGEELHALLKEKLDDFRKTLVGKDKDMAIFDERLVSDEPLTLQELGDRFGISRERVRQLEQRLTMRLREFLKEEMGDAAEAT